MANTGFTTSGTQASTQVNVNDSAWSNLTNVNSSDDSYATATQGTQDRTERLDLTNFGFSIDTGATINGVVVRVEGSSSVGNDFIDDTVQLIKTGTPSGDNKIDTLAWGATDRTEDYPLNDSTTDLWGLTLTPTDINATNFGVAIRWNRDGGANRTAQIDYVAIDVYFTIPNDFAADSRTITIAGSLGTFSSATRAIRKRDKSNSRITDKHPDGKIFHHFRDNRHKGCYVLQESATDKRTRLVGPTSTGQDLIDYNAQKAVIDDVNWNLDTSPDLTKTEAEDWEVKHFFETVIWPRFLEVDSGTFQNNPQKERTLRGVLIAFGVPDANAFTIADGWVFDETGKPEFEDLGLTDILDLFKNMIHAPRIDESENIAEVIKIWNTDFPLDYERALAAIMTMRIQGWDRMWLHVDYDGFMRMTLGTGTPGTQWTYKNFQIGEFKVDRDETRFAEQMYIVADAAANNIISKSGLIIISGSNATF